MKHHLPPLDTLKAFEAAARHLSFSLAAEELCISKGAVSYQIRKLEEWIQCSLFKRSVRQVYLTDAGQALLQTTRLLFGELDQTLLRLSDTSQQTAVTVAATTYVAARWLSSRIAAFNSHYPEIAIHLQHSVNSADFKLMEVDMAIRWGLCDGRRDRNRLKEIPMPLFPAISPTLLQQTGLTNTHPLAKTTLQDSRLQQIPLLCEDRHQDLWQEWFSQEGKTLKQPRRIIADANVRVQAAIDGQGWILADDMMKGEIGSGLLTVPFSEALTGYGYVLLRAPGRITNGNAQFLRKWLLTDTEL